MNDGPRSLSIKVLVCLFATLLISSCGMWQTLTTRDDKPKEPKADRPTPLTQFKPEATIRVLWRRNIGRGIGPKFIDVSPAIEEGIVYAADAYGFVAAVENESGRFRWMTRIGRPSGKGFMNVMDRSDPAFVTGGLGVGADMIYVGTARGEVVALAATDGEERWRVVLTSEVLAPPIASRDAVYAQTSDGNLFALALEDGAQKWVFHTQNPLVTLRGTSTPIFNAGIVYAGFATGILSAIDSTSGELLWEQAISLPTGTSDLERMVDVDGKPLVEQGVVVASTHQGTTTALRRSDGIPLWQAEVASTKALQSGYGLVFAVTDDDEIVGIEQRDGTVAWRHDGLLRRQLTDPLAFSNYIFVGDLQGFVHVIAQSDGRLIARRRVDSAAIQPTMAHEDGVVYLLSKGGRLIALELDRSS
ncbi:MAG: outer membrane protein assembly factor BamB [Gammaproteobacteria bacterium]|nr:outer membrane protein assembly factor BamB [Gammaproteobacteria bacterium]